MKRKLAIIAALLSIGIGLAVVLGRGAAGEKLFERALQENVGVDPSLALGDGLHAYVCGSGSPMPDADRAGPCIAVLAGRQGFVFDAGSGSIRKLQRMGFPMERLQGAYLTHLHSDHIDGLGELLLQAWVAGSRSTPLPVSGPDGTQKVIAGLMQAYSTDRDFRIAHHGADVVRPGGFGGKAAIIALANGESSKLVHDSDGVRITVYRVNHAPVAPAFGYRIDYRGRSISISGDTVYSPDLVSASRGVDLLFHEALNPKMIGAISAQLKARGRNDTAKIMADIPGYHASPADAARAAQAAGAKALVLYHLVPAIPSSAIEPLFLDGARDQFDGRLELAQDGMIVSLPAGASDIRFTEAF